MRRIANLLILAALAGCAARPSDRAANLDTLVGQPEALVLKVMGAPDRRFDAAGHRFLEYVEREPASFAGYDMYDGYGRYGRLGYRRLGFEADPKLYERGCETTIQIDQGRVAAYRLWGNYCGDPVVASADATLP